MTIKLMERLDNHLSSEAKQTKSKTIQLSHCKKRRKKKENHGGLTATLLRFRILGVADVDHLAAFTQRVLGRVALQGLAGHDTVYFWQLVWRPERIRG